VSQLPPLPIDPLLPEVVSALRHGSRLVLRAAPGAGKTTRVPAALLDAGLAGDKQILVLEPRRIAARAAAEYVARERGGRVGEEVGYRVRFDSRGGDRTRLWFVTEGILGRQLVADPFLERVGTVVLDEFHERHLQGDVALAVIAELQESVRPDLALLVMSATLETERVSAYLGGCPVLTSEGRSHPVAVEYEPGREREPVQERVARALRRVAAARAGDVLVFLPGAREIARTAEAIAPLAAEHDLEVVPLHGDLGLDEQQRALRRGPRRKVVLSTNVAETSLTIDGVTIVIDSGQARLNRFDARRGINALRLVPISRASADQRAGRAGRLAPGLCVRLWSQAEQAERRDAEIPEVRRLDLAATVLELRAWGLQRIEEFRWLDPPERGALGRAEHLLRRLGAFEAESGALTEVGRRMLTLGAEPRLARMLVEAEQRGQAAAGALIAALASERDICRAARVFGQASAPHAAGPSDLLLRAELFEQAARRGFSSAACAALDLEPRALRAVERARRHFAAALARGSRAAAGARSASGAAGTAALQIILAGFPDRVARRRAPGSARALMVGNTGVVLDPQSVVRDAELFVAVELDAGERRAHSEARVRLASELRLEWLRRLFPDSLRRTSELVFDPEGERVVERRTLRFDDLVLEEKSSVDVDRAAAGEVLAEAARRDPRRAARVGDEEERLLGRIAFLARWMPELELPAAVETLLGEAVASLCWNRRTFAEVRAQDLGAALLASLSHAQRQALAREAPRELRLPSGRAARIEYGADKPPSAAARIQEVFGLRATPRLAGGRVPLVLELLAPNRRPAQITDDLESFWRNTYPEVRKQLRGRYPKHAWPENP